MVIFILGIYSPGCVPQVRKKSILIVSKKPPPKVSPREILNLSPFFVQGLAGKAMEMFASKRYKQAMELFSQYRNSLSLKDPLYKRAQFLEAIAAQQAQEHKKALELFRELRDTYPLLLDYHRYFAAVNASKEEEPLLAVLLAESVSKESPLFKEAILVAAENLLKSQLFKEAEKKYREYLAHNSVKKSRAEFGLAQAIENQLKSPANEQRIIEAIKHYQLALLSSPLHADTSKIERRISRLKSLLKEPSLIPEDLKKVHLKLQKGITLFQNMQNKEAEKIFREVLSETKPSSLVWCQAIIKLAKSIYRQRDRKRAGPIFMEAVNKCKDQNIKIEGLYFAGICYFSKEKLMLAKKNFERVERDYFFHRYADDARIYNARISLKLKDEDRFERLLLSLPQDYPTGDMRKEALWLVAWHNYKQKRFVKSKEILTKSLEQIQDENQRWALRGRELYWRARILERLEKTKEALESYKECIKRYPFSYYMLQAFTRLSNLDPKEAERLKETIIKKGEREISPKKKLQKRWVVPLDIPSEDKGYIIRGVELFRLSLFDLAKKELGMLLKKNRNLKEEVLWLITIIYHRVGDYHRSHIIPKERLKLWRKGYPHKEAREYWMLAYPQGFRRLVKRYAKKARLPESFLYAIIREESAFNPKAESWANAIGLTQLLVSTAKKFSKGIIKRVTPRRLKNPKINIAIGSRFLEFLWKNFNKNPVLVAAGYNAGHGAARRWLKENKGLALDEFVENIPYSQTRRYSKSVISSYGVYNFLYSDSGDILILPLNLGF